MGKADPLKAHKFTVVIEDGDNYPFEYRENGKLTGYHIEVITTVAKDLNWKVSWLPIPWARARAALENRDADAMSYFVTTPGKEEKGIVLLEGNILHHPSGALFIKTERKKQLIYKGGSLNPLKKYTIGIVLGDALDNIMTLYYPELKVDRTAKTYEQLFKMLDENRFDIAIAHGYGLRSISRTHPELKNKITMIHPAVGSSDAYIAFADTRKGRECSKQFAVAFNKFKKSATYPELAKKYGLSSFSISKPRD